jgi:hypothetical protein
MITQLSLCKGCLWKAMYVDHKEKKLFERNHHLKFTEESLMCSTFFLALGTSGVSSFISSHQGRKTSRKCPTEYKT